MARVEVAPELGEDFDRICDQLAQYDLEHAAARIGEIIQAFNVLASNPLIGRPAAPDLRQLIIGRSSRACVALYRYVAELDTAFVLALKSQQEAGYKHD